MMKKTNNLKIIPLGGLGEVGRNMTLLEWKEKILIIDMGLKFPDEEMLGIDYIIPNIDYLKDKKNNIVGVVFTHGHYDHIGAVPYLINKIGNPPLFASPLTKGIILVREQLFPNQPRLNIQEIKNGSKVKLGPFKVEFFKQNHNIPDNMGLFIQTPVGNILHTSDFKFDQNPVNDSPTDFKKLKELSSRGILLLMSDSTGAEEKGHSLSEKTIMDNLEKIFIQAQGKRIIASTFASHINRIQQLISLSEKYKRYVAIDGFGMKMNVEICRKLGYIKIRKGTLISPKRIRDYPDSKITLICTGAQGEDRAILMKIATGQYPYLKVKKGDNIIFSSSVVPGNERTVQNLKDEFFRKKANVFHYKMMDIHASGHARQEELKEMIKIMRPKFFMPIHGQYSMLVNHAHLAMSLGIPEKNIIVADNGNIINLNKNKIYIDKKTVPAEYIMVDGLGTENVKEVVLRDRKALANDGIFVIIAVVDHITGKVKGSPDIISRGFVYLRESKRLLAEARRKVISIINKATNSPETVNWNYVKTNVRNDLGKFLFIKTQKRPMVLPVIIEV